MEPFLNSGGAFRPQIVKVGAESASTQEKLLKYNLDLPLHMLFVRVEEIIQINSCLLIHYCKISYPSHQFTVNIKY